MSMRVHATPGYQGALRPRLVAAESSIAPQAIATRMLAMHEHGKALPCESPCGDEEWTWNRLSGSQGADIASAAVEWLTESAGLREQRRERGRILQGDAHSARCRADPGHCESRDAGWDLAYLAADLDAMGTFILANEIVGRYILQSGDETLGLLQPLHRLLSAIERAHAPPPDIGAGRFAKAAEGYAFRRYDPALVLVCGLPGTSCSLLAATVAGSLGAACVTSQSSRARVLAQAERDHGLDGLDGLDYRREVERRTYKLARRGAAAHLRAGRSVVVETSAWRRDVRNSYRALAADAGAQSICVESVLDEQLGLQRFQSLGGSADDYLSRRSRFQSLKFREGLMRRVHADRRPGFNALRVTSRLLQRQHQRREREAEASLDADYDGVRRL